MLSDEASWLTPSRRRVRRRDADALLDEAQGGRGASRPPRRGRVGYRKPEPTSVATYATEWPASYPEAKGLKRSPVETQRAIVRSHLIPGITKLVAIGVEQIERHVADKRRGGLTAWTMNRHLSTLSRILTTAAKRGLVPRTSSRLSSGRGSGRSSGGPYAGGDAGGRARVGGYVDAAEQEKSGRGGKRRGLSLGS